VGVVNIEKIGGKILNNNIESLVNQVKIEVENTTADLRELIELVEENTCISKDKNGKLNVSNKLSIDELYAFAIRIPAECAFIQERINEYSAAYSIKSIRTGNEVTSNIEVFLSSKGDAKERLRRAERLSEDQILADEASLQIVKALQAYIERADKVYEGIKKVIDSRTKEWNYDRKYSANT